jgi:DNA-binding LacI/PurR family transcriptional regulator
VERATPPRRRPTINDIAAAAGVSKGLVSMVLSGSPGPSAATAERVLALADHMGYRANRSATLLARRRTRLLGVTLLPSNGFHGEIVEQIQLAARAAGYDLVLGSMIDNHDEAHAIETLVDFRCEALLLLGPTAPPARLRSVIDHLPTVVVGRHVDLPDVDVVRADDKRGISDVVDHLVSLGHRHIAHIDGGTGLVSDARRRAYRSAVRRHGLTPLVLRGGLAESDGAAAVDLMPTDAGITAVVAFNDRTAVGAIDRLERRGITVPHDMSVTGFDDSLLARHSRINLTTVSQAQLEQARLAVELALERLEGGRTEPREIVLPAQLVIRSSTATPSTAPPRDVSPADSGQR